MAGVEVDRQPEHRLLAGGLVELEGLAQAGRPRVGGGGRPEPFAASAVTASRTCGSSPAGVASSDRWATKL